MAETDKAGNGGLGLAFLLTEIRDLRKGLEARDARLNGAIEALRADFHQMSAALTSSQDRVTRIESSVSDLHKEFREVRSEVDALVVKDRRDSAKWDGVKHLLRNLSMLGAAVGGVSALLYFLSPAIRAILFKNP